MIAAPSFLERLDNLSDRLSPIVVKEVRQMVRGREFNYSFGLSLITGLTVAFFGAAGTWTGYRSGAWTVGWQIGCLTVLGLIVIPLATMGALRSEKSERTFDLITLTTLSPRRIVIGKLTAQGVKLVTLFAGAAPFIATGFLLGGIDFVTIIVSLTGLFLLSLWACAACLFLSCLSTSRAVSGVIYAAVGLVFLFLIGPGGGILRLWMFGGPGFYAYGPPGMGLTGLSLTGSLGGGWWMFAIIASFCLMTIVNLVLLSENRLTLPTENRVTALRIGFFLQFLLIVAWVVLAVYLIPGPTPASSGIDGLGVVAGLQLAAVAVFTVTEDLLLSRRMVLQSKSSRLRWLMPVLGPGGAAGAIYVLVQMALLLGIGQAIAPSEMRWLTAICGYICFFTGVPVLAARVLAPRLQAKQVRVAALLFFPVVMLLADLVGYLASPGGFNFEYSRRHVLNPFRTLANWPVASQFHWDEFALAIGAIGFIVYLALIRMGWRANQEERNVPAVD